MSRFSIVVPMLGTNELFENTLASVLRYRPAHSQILVPHQGNYIDEYGLGGDVNFMSCGQVKSLLPFWNQTLTTAVGEFVCIFRPGIELAEGWEDLVLDAMRDASTAMVSPVIEFADQRNGKKQIVGVNVDSSGTRTLQPFARGQQAVVGPTSHAAVYRNEALGWLPPSDVDFEDLYLDLDLALSLKALGYQCVVDADWRVACSGEALLAESQQPHGCVASRGLRRHGDQIKGTGSPWVADGLAVVRGQLWRLQHAVGRLAAKQHQQTDRKFKTQLIRSRNTRMDLEVQRRSSAIAPAARRRAA